MPLKRKHDSPLVAGLSYSTHDSSACVVAGGVIVAAIAKERLTRIRHDGGWGAGRADARWDLSGCLEYCLRAADATANDLDLIVENHVLGDSVEALHRQVGLSVPPAYPVDRAQMISHHLAHAYSAYFASGFDDALVLVIDGVGNPLRSVADYAGEDSEYIRTNWHAYARVPAHACETLSAYSANQRSLSAVRKDFGFESIGLAYRTVTAKIFGNLRDAGKTMGLAAFGQRNRCEYPLIDAEHDKLSYPYQHSLAAGDLPRPVKSWPARTAVWTPDHWLLADLAARAQFETEEAVLALAKSLREKTGHRRLCLAGGVALNSVANRRLLDEGGFDDVFVFPAAGDDGVSVGCAYWGSEHVHPGIVARRRLDAASFGRSYSHRECTDAAHRDLRIATDELGEEQLIARVAMALSEGRTVGWFDGGSELGPRALGHRTILSSTHPESVRDRLNATVKFREAFRPFAPIVTAEKASEYFDLSQESPFMLFVSKVRSDKLASIPGAIHVDGTARVQTLRSDQNPRLYQVLLEFERLTGVPVLINTSLNLRGEPIVETPVEAVECLLNSGLDCLVLGSLWLEKRTPSDLELAAASISINENVRLSLTHSFATVPPYVVDSVVFFGVNTEREVRLDSLQRRLLLNLSNGPLPVSLAIEQLEVQVRTSKETALKAIRSAIDLNLCRVQ